MGLKISAMIPGRNKKENKRFHKKQLRNKIKDLSKDNNRKPKKKKKFTDWNYFLKTKGKPDPYSNIVELMYKFSHGPRCRTCSENYAPYDMEICKECEAAINRLRKGNTD